MAPDMVFTCPASRDKSSSFGRERGGQASDDGTAICESLGLPCTHINRLSFLEEFPDEILFYAGYYRGDDVNLREIGSYSDSVAVLLTGSAGDMWETVDPGKEELHSETGTFGSTDLALHGMGEYRLLVGLIQLPVPFIAGRRRDEIHAIARSSEMDS